MDDTGGGRGDAEDTRSTYYHYRRTIDMGRRIGIDAWGRGDYDTPAYAVTTDDTPCASDAVAAAIARRSRAYIASGPHSDGHGETRDGRVTYWRYRMTLERRGMICAEVWYDIHPRDVE